MTESRIVKRIQADVNNSIQELYEKKLVRDYRGLSVKRTGKLDYNISYSGKDTKISNIIYDKHISADKIIDALLKGYQYNILLYDKSLIQLEFEIRNNVIMKERLLFMKMHNRTWDICEINEYEQNNQDWFTEEKGIPIMFRIDYAPEDHIECDHAITHATLSNHECCRIPIKGIVTVSEFVRFILFHFYGIKMELKVNRSMLDETITDLEKTQVHINWN